MAEDIAKLKVEFRNEILKVKEELQKELKTSLETSERGLLNEIHEVKKEQTELTSSIEYTQNDFEELQKKLEIEIVKNSKLMGENQELSSRCAALEKKSRDLEIQLVQTEQYSRNINIEIKGFPEKEDENIDLIPSTFGNAVKEPITSLDVEAAHRVRTPSSGKSNIVVRFKSKAKRDVMLQKAKKCD
ncbi:hypothetical protein V5799_020426 [Amblyomma americanum]|uniref:Uncharacterized protein n=1 Tax=Amblyomma americanum TaxID=6943 RepID=A0AAQ4EUR9_AMBAM